MGGGLDSKESRRIRLGWACVELPAVTGFPVTGNPSGMGWEEPICGVRAASSITSGIPVDGSRACCAFNSCNGEVVDTAIVVELAPY